MKKIISALIFLGVLAHTVPASEIKAMFGMNWNKYLFSDQIDSLNHQQKTGLLAGLGWSLELKDNIQVEINLLYSQKGAKVSLPYGVDHNIAGIYENTTIGVPVLLKYRFNEKASPYAALGPEFVFVLSHHLKIPGSGEDFDILESTKKMVLAFNVLLGYELPIGQWGVFAEFRYNRWLGNFWLGSDAQAKSESFAVLLGGAYYLK